MIRSPFIAVGLWLAVALFRGNASAQSYLGASNLGSLRQGNPAVPALPPSSGRRGSAPVTDAPLARDAINRAASERTGAQPGPSAQEVAATQRALDTRDLQHPRQTRTFDAIARPSRPD
ncbi:hypothetical protein [Pandoraea sputorum]|uniref:Uncharacterized protein n=1 Tax=Pandoraea sputorum TaxID=93222 RepID=A0A5E5BJI0_9BURK|nr:hypothetical protein [Pandoraea sputorum]VVE85426.1 hypothetical protein PSP31121_05244 [Pandoraea sputorum]